MLAIKGVQMFHRLFKSWPVLTIALSVALSLGGGCTQVQPAEDSTAPAQRTAPPRSEPEPIVTSRVNTQTEDDHYARGIVIQALTMPNNLGVGGREFRTKLNPKGEGVFVHDPRTRFSGVKRNLIWLVIDDTAYPLNGPSKMLTPSLRWPRETDEAIWRTTGLSPYMATEAIEIVFGK